MNKDAKSNPKIVLSGTKTQFCNKNPPIKPIHVIDAAVIRLMRSVDDWEEIFRVKSSLIVINITAATANKE